MTIQNDTFSEPSYSYSMAFKTWTTYSFGKIFTCKAYESDNVNPLNVSSHPSSLMDTILSSTITPYFMLDPIIITFAVWRWFFFKLGFVYRDLPFHYVARSVPQVSTNIDNIRKMLTENQNLVEWKSNHETSLNSDLQLENSLKYCPDQKCRSEEHTSELQSR